MFILRIHSFHLLIRSKGDDNIAGVFKIAILKIFILEDIILGPLISD